MFSMWEIVRNIRVLYKYIIVFIFMKDEVILLCLHLLTLREVYWCIYIQELTNTGMLKGMHMIFCEKCFCYGTVVITEWLPLQGTVKTKYSV